MMRYRHGLLHRPYQAAIFDTEMRIGHTMLSADLIAACVGADTVDEG